MTRRSTVTIEPYEGDTAYGPSWGDGVEHPATVQARRRRVTTAEGRDIVASATVLLDADVAVVTESRVVIDGTRHTAVEVLTHRGPTGRVSLVEVLCA